MKDRLEDILNQKLRNVTVQPEGSDWIRIERSLGLAPRKSVPLGRYLAVAASLAIVAVMGFYLSTREQAGLPASAPLVATVSPDVVENPIPAIPESAPPHSAIEAVRQLKNAIDQANSLSSLTAAAVSVEEPRTSEGEALETAAPAGSRTGTSGTATQSRPNHQAQRYAQSNHAASRNNAYDSNAYFASDAPGRNQRDARKNSGSNWALALFTDGMGGFGNPGAKDYDRMQHTVNDAPSTIMKDLFLQNSNGDALSEVDLTKALMMKVEQADMKHNMPLSFGITVRKRLTDHWGIETGLVYTYHSAKSELSTSYDYRLKQQLHYLGVPLAFTYTPLRRNNFELYARAGAAVDFNIGTKLTQTTRANNSGAYASAPIVTRFTKEGAQWSVSGNIGVMYNFSPVVGIYLEPGVSHYFENSQQPDSYWKENPTNFNLKLGIRTTF